METVTGQEQAEAAQEPAPKVSLWEDIVDVFVSPAGLFRRQAQASWVKPWLVLSVILVVLYFVFWGPNREVAMASAQEMLARANRQVPAGAQPGGGTVGQVISGVFQPVILLIGVLVGGLLLWIASLVAQGGPRYKQAMTIVAWASFPTILQKVVVGVLVLLKTSSGEPLSAMRDTSTGILRFLDTGSLPLPLLSALGLVDVFVFWQLILWVVALKVICHYSAGKATAVAVATWLLMVPLLMSLGLLGQLAMGAGG
jgi:hypothetical protein